MVYQIVFWGGGYGTLYFFNQYYITGPLYNKAIFDYCRSSVKSFVCRVHRRTSDNAGLSEHLTSWDGADRMTGLMDEINWKISSRMEHLDQQTPSSIKKPHTSSPCIHSTNTTTIIMNIPPQSSLSTHRPSHTATSAAAVAAARRPAANGRGIATMLAHALHILLIMGGVPYAEGLLSIPPAKVISSIGRPSSRAALDSLSCGNARVVHSCSSGSSSRRRRRRRLVCMSRKEGAEDVCNAPAEDAFDLRRMDAQAEHVINW